MNRIFKYMALALAAVVTMGCVQEYMEIDPDQVPQASELQVKIDVDQATNYVTFSIENQGMVPMWLFGEELIDGKANKKYAYSGNGISLRFRDAGTHSVEVKAYNAHGISVGSKVVDFSMENTYRDPFDPNPYLKAIKGEWQWNNEVAGHFGCGPSTDSPFEWWKAGANEKADWSLYDDRMTFTEDGKYLFNPGEDGKVYVNAGFTALGTTPDGNDFLVDIPAYETTYLFENNWNDAGIEEIWLVLPGQKNLSYIPNQTIYDQPRFLVMDSKPSAMKKELKLAADNAPNGDTFISWYYNFIPAVKVATPEELLAGTDAKGKVWVMDSSVKGHLGCGSTAANPVEWWSANPDEKAGFGMYDNTLTFFSDGKYVFDSGEDGNIYANKCVTALGVTGATEDYVAPYADLESTYQFDGETLSFPEGVTVGYVPNDNCFNNPVFTVTELTETKLVLVTFETSADNPDGIAWQMIFRARDVQPAPEPDQPVVAPFDPAAADNLWNNAAINVTYWFANSSWGQIADPEATLGNNEYTFVVPAEVGGSEWQGQVVFRNTGLVLSPDKTYDFRAIISATNDGTATIKPCYQHPTELDGNGNPADVNELFYDNGIAVTAYEDLEYIKAALPGTDIPDLKLVFDFGRFPAGTTVTVKGIVIRESQVTGGGSTPDVPAFDPEAASNMWNDSAIEGYEYYYAPGWAQIDAPEVEQDGRTYTVTLPQATTDQWQAQMKIFTNLSTSADKTYDFYCVLNSSNDHPGTTIKLTKTGDDNSFYFADRHVLTAYEDYVYQVVGMAGIDMEKMTLVFDFGGCAAGTEITISDIIIRESQSAPAPEPEPTPGEFTPGAQLDLLDAADVLPGTWTWEASTDGHFGCGDAITNPCGWWNGTANCKEGCSMYDDLMTFAADGTYTYDPVDGMTFMNNGVTKMNDKKVDNPTVPGAAAPEGDFRVSVEKQTATWELDEFGEFPAIILPAGTIFSYIPNDAFLEAPELYITGVWENQLEISAYTATGNGGGPIAWRYRLKRVN